MRAIRKAFISLWINIFPENPSTRKEIDVNEKAVEFLKR